MRALIFATVFGFVVTNPIYQVPVTFDGQKWIAYPVPQSIHALVNVAEPSKKFYTPLVKKVTTSSAPVVPFSVSEVGVVVAVSDTKKYSSPTTVTVPVPSVNPVLRTVEESSAVIDGLKSPEVYSETRLVDAPVPALSNIEPKPVSPVAPTKVLSASIYSASTLTRIFTKSAKDQKPENIVIVPKPVTSFAIPTVTVIQNSEVSEPFSDEISFVTMSEDETPTDIPTAESLDVTLFPFTEKVVPVATVKSSPVLDKTVKFHPVLVRENIPLIPVIEARDDAISGTVAEEPVVIADAAQVVVPEVVFPDASVLEADAAQIIVSEVILPDAPVLKTNAAQVIVPEVVLPEAAVESTVIVAPVEPLEAPDPPMPSLEVPFVGGQFHSQDEAGRYTFGHYGGPNTRVEVRDSLGRTAGSFAYVDPEGDVQVRKYASNPGSGFRVAASDLPGDDSTGPE